jgi:hypothetical protein
VLALISLFPLFRWLEQTWVGDQIRSSTYLFPSIEVVHLLGLVVLFGPLLVVDLRLMGFGMRRQTVTRVAEDLAPWTLLGIGTMLVTGLLLLLSEAVKCYQNQAFWFKMEFLAPALIFHFTVYRKVTSSDTVKPIWAKAAGFLSLLLWFGVGLGGRAIAFI